MRIDIHDVDHGACATITGPRGHRLMLDCGQSLTRPWFPSVTFRGSIVNTLLLMNLDEDHVEDLEDLWESTRILAFGSNPTVSAAALKFMKPSGMRRGVTAAHNILSTFGPGFHGRWLDDLGGVHWQAFWNKYGADFTDTNNLSMAVFVKFGPFTALFGGDLETAGWRKLLMIPAFRARLPDVNLFVAYHGRESGKCDELFQWCTPDLIVFSDGPKEYDSQETTGWYSRRAKGLPDRSHPASLFCSPMRYVITTRSDGTIHVDVNENGRWNVTINPRPALGLGGLGALSLFPPVSPWGSFG